MVFLCDNYVILDGVGVNGGKYGTNTYNLLTNQIEILMLGQNSY